MRKHIKYDEKGGRFSDGVSLDLSQIKKVGD
jgi:hypothetical protein